MKLQSQNQHTKLKILETQKRNQDIPNQVKKAGWENHDIKVRKKGDRKGMKRSKTMKTNPFGHTSSTSIKHKRTDLIQPRRRREKGVIKSTKEVAEK